MRLCRAERGLQTWFEPPPRSSTPNVPAIFGGGVFGHRLAGGSGKEGGKVERSGWIWVQLFGVYHTRVDFFAQGFFDFVIFILFLGCGWGEVNQLT